MSLKKNFYKNKRLIKCNKKNMINKNKNELKDLQIQGQIKIIQLTNDITGGIIKSSEN